MKKFLAVIAGKEYKNKSDEVNVLTVFGNMASSNDALLDLSHIKTTADTRRLSGKDWFHENRSPGYRDATRLIRTCDQS